MMTYKKLRSYDVDILNRMLEQEREAQIKYKEKNELDHYRMTLKQINKIEKIIKEKENEII